MSFDVCDVLRCADALFFSEYLCIFNRMPVSIPIIPDDPDLLRFNDFFAHLFRALGAAQGMSAFNVNPSKGVTINSILDAKFPAIPSTKNKPTPLLSIRTVAYIHALVIDTVSLHHSDTPNQRALRTEQTIIDEQGEIDPALWRSEILDCLAGYFEGILKMENASGVSQVVAPTRTYSAKKIPIVAANPIDAQAPCRNKHCGRIAQEPRRESGLDESTVSGHGREAAPTREPGLAQCTL